MLIQLGDFCQVDFVLVTLFFDNVALPLAKLPVKNLHMKRHLAYQTQRTMAKNSVADVNRTFQIISGKANSPMKCTDYLKGSSILLLSIDRIIVVSLASNSSNSGPLCECVHK